MINVDDFTVENLQLLLKEFSESNNIKYSYLMKTLRYIISGLKASKSVIKLPILMYFYFFIYFLQQGPGVSEIMIILGKEDVIARLSRAH